MCTPGVLLGILVISLHYPGGCCFGVSSVDSPGSAVHTTKLFIFVYVPLVQKLRNAGWCKWSLQFLDYTGNI